MQTEASTSMHSYSLCSMVLLCAANVCTGLGGKTCRNALDAIVLTFYYFEHVDMTDLHSISIDFLF